MSKVLQEYWETAEAEEKAKYEEMAVADKVRYEKDCASSGFDPETGEVPGGGSKRKASVIISLGKDNLPLPRKPKFGADKPPPEPRAKTNNEGDFSLVDEPGGTAQRRRRRAEDDRQGHLENAVKATADDASAETVAAPSASRKEVIVACPQVDEGGDDKNHREGGGTIEVSQQMTLDQLRAMILEEFDEDQCARSYPPSLLTPSLSPHPTSNTLSNPNPPSLARTAESRTAAHARAGCPRVSRAVPSSTSASRASVSPRRKKPARGRGSAATAASSCVPRDRALPRPPSPYQPPPRQPPSCSPLLSRLPPPRLLLRPSLCQERLQCRLPSRPRSLLPYAPIPPRRWRPSRPR